MSTYIDIGIQLCYPASLLFPDVRHATVLLHALSACLATIYYRLLYASAHSGIWFLGSASRLQDAQAQFSTQAQLIA